MTDVTMSTQLPAGVEQVWKQVGSFFGLADWHPAVSSCEAIEGGQKRRITLADGNQLVEELVAHDDGSHTYTYTMEQTGPLPVSNYKATIRVEPDGDTTKVTWSGSFEPVGAETDARKAIENVYQTGLDNLKRMFGGA